MNKVVLNTLLWLAAIAVALALAAFSPTESNVMGRLPAVHAKRLDQQPVALHEALPAERTLALITFSKTQRPDAESWIRGLELNQTRSISWVRMPVMNDPGNEDGRAAIEHRLRARFPSEWERSRMLAVFTDRDAFIRSAGLPGAHSAYAVVLNRQGEVLARAEGEFDQDKAAALRETLLGQSGD